MTADDRTQAVFGAFDGLASALGMVIALAVAGSTHALVVGAVALAFAAGASMAAGEWLSDHEQSPRRAVVMGLATLVGGLAPAVPFALGSGIVAYVGTVSVAVMGGAIIAELRPGAPLPSYLQTFGVLVGATTLGVAASLLA